MLSGCPSHASGGCCDYAGAEARDANRLLTDVGNSAPPQDKAVASWAEAERRACYRGAARKLHRQPLDHDVDQRAGLDDRLGATQNQLVSVGWWDEVGQSPLPVEEVLIDCE